MKINTLRRIDSWIGNPVCLLMSAACLAKHFFLKKGPLRQPRKILFIKLFGLGSIVLALPAVRAVREKFPQASLYFLSFRENEELFSLTGLIQPEHVITVRRDSPAHFIRDVLRSFFMLIQEKIDVVIDLEFFCRFTAIFSFLIRSRHRIGLHSYNAEGMERGSFIDFRINYNHTIHTARMFFALLKPLGIEQDEFSAELPPVLPSAGFSASIASLIAEASGCPDSLPVETWIIINPNASDLISLRRWPADHFLRLTRLLLNHHASLGVIFIGSIDERKFVGSLCNAFRSPDTLPRVLNLAGLTTLRELIDLFHFCDLLITNDSGPAHLASLTDIPNIVIFGPETPELYAPLGKATHCLYQGFDCQPCVTAYNGKRSDCRDNICLQRIEPETVFLLAAKHLASVRQWRERQTRLAAVR